MKQCPRCSQTYSDDTLNFCLSDGELLSYVPPGRVVDDSPPTMILDQARVTDPLSGWQQQSAQPPAKWQPQTPAAQFGGFGMAVAQDKTFPTVALVLGILSLAVSCCYGGIWLGLPAAIIGFIGMKNVDKDPNRYGGRGLALAGMIMGVISFLITLLIVFAAIFSR
ncbi:MAG TPA: DUF4190 domain-containing protein [Pyrinomonadaceae bacterium]|jgi:hypothetical protein|nr:DUF4190 domain-containing protein [Pyrinomonadaceae bacterium]